ncbi:MAG: tetratricopeptide repeat protein [bacterium]
MNDLQTKNKLEEAINLYRAKDFANAELLFKELIKENENNADAWYFLGLLAMEVNKNKLAVGLFNRAIAITPKEHFLIKKCVALYNVEDYRALEQCTIALIKINPKPEYYCNLGVAYSKLEKYDLSIQCYHKTIALNPDFAPVYSNLGLALKNKERYKESIDSYKKAIQLDPNFVDAYYNMAISYVSCKQLDNAVINYKKALELDRNYKDAYLNLSIAYLLGRNFEEGWKYYEYRYNNLIEPAPNVKEPKPKWQGESLEGKTIYVMHEQGFGDSIQFVRYLAGLKKFGAKKIIFKSQKLLKQLFVENNFDPDIEIIDEITSENDIYFDYYTLLLSLPGYLKVNEFNLYTRDAYLKANQDKVIDYKQQYFDNDKYKVGIVWQGSLTHKSDNKRSVPLEKFYPLFDFENVQLYSLQKGAGEEQMDKLPEKFNIIKLGDSFNDFGDSAAAIENLDLIITIDSAVAHLAAALGKETWVILPQYYEWRWALDDDFTPWYSSMRFFRPQLYKDRLETMDRVMTAFKKRRAF